MAFILVAAVVAWLVAQAIKVVLTGKPKVFFALGGMPSSHSTFVSALTTAVGLREGFAEPLFYVTLAFSIVVIVDALKLKKRHTVQEVSAGVALGVLVSGLLFWFRYGRLF